MTVLSRQSLSAKPLARPDTEPVEITLNIDVSDLPLQGQNALIAAMDEAGFGPACSGEYASMSPPTLVAPLKLALFTFTVLPGPNDGEAVAGAINEAQRIARRHGAKLLSARSSVAPVTRPCCRERVAATQGLDLLLITATVDDALSLLNGSETYGDVVLWQGNRIVAVRFAEGSVFRMWPDGLPPLAGGQPRAS